MGVIGGEFEVTVVILSHQSSQFGSFRLMAEQHALKPRAKIQRVARKSELGAA